MRAFVTAQRKRPEYLHDGDIVTSTIATADGAIDLGRQEWQVASAAPAAAALPNGERLDLVNEHATVSDGDN
jgi:hypothetical protein